jgi:hypothetical protein
MSSRQEEEKIYIEKLYKEHGLPSNPNPAQIEPVATPLLNDESTLLLGAELVLGRRVNLQELEIVSEPTTPIQLVRFSFGLRFSVLLMQFNFEQSQRELTEKQLTLIQPQTLN